MLWQLHYHRDVVHYLVSMRESGHNLRFAIYSLQKSERGVPSENVTQIADNAFVWSVENHLVTLEVNAEQKRISVFNVAPDTKDAAGAS
jgi:hypothetical protein